MSRPIRVVGFRATGAVRGPCDHRHGTALLAQRCADADARRCDKRGLYSDRVVVPALTGDAAVDQDGDEVWLSACADRYAEAIVRDLGAMPRKGDRIFLVHGVWTVGWEPPTPAKPPHRDQMTLDVDVTTVAAEVTTKPHEASPIFDRIRDAAVLDFAREASERYFGVR